MAFTRNSFLQAGPLSMPGSYHFSDKNDLTSYGMLVVLFRFTSGKRTSTGSSRWPSFSTSGDSFQTETTAETLLEPNLRQGTDLISLSCFAGICLSPCTLLFDQGTLTEGEGVVPLTSSFRYLYCKNKIKKLLQYRNNCSKLVNAIMSGCQTFPLVRVP